MNALLLRAADIIQANGLARGEYVDLLAGDPPLPVDKCPVCPRSAIALAAGRDPLFVVEWPSHCDAGYDEDDESGQIATDGERATRAEILSAEKALRRYLVAELGVPSTDDTYSDGEVIEVWADEDGRTQPQVVGALRAAAEQDEAAGA